MYVVLDFIFVRDTMLSTKLSAFAWPAGHQLGFLDTMQHQHHEAIFSSHPKATFKWIQVEPL